MSCPRLLLIVAAASLAASCAPPPHPATTPLSVPQAADSADRARARHVLDRLTYGPRPGDVDRVLSQGTERFIDEQLGLPGRLDTVVAARLDKYDVIRFPGDLVVAYQEYQRRQQDLGLLRNLRSRGMICSSEDQVGLHQLEDVVSRIAVETETARVQQIDRRVNQLVAQYQQATVVRAALSERQLYEIMVDFWTNHFNVFVGKANDRFLIRSYIEETIRPHALGRFEELLVATATNPAMLVYLDNAQSVAPGSSRPRSPASPGPRPPADALRCHPGPPPPPPPRAPGPPVPRPVNGLNENYGRELLELHTLGVDGGYTQQDVINVARILTGWSVTPVTEDPGFVFNAWAHDRKEKRVLGRRFSAGGDMNEGLALLKMLARQPATMRHVSTKLCARFVNDDPPPDCVDAAMRTWKHTDGDLRQIVRAIIHSRSFWQPENREAKVKTPLQFVVSAMRAVAADPDTTLAVAQLVARLGEPLFGEIAPTGYPESQNAWMNSGALLQRMNAAVDLASGRQPGLKVNLDQVALRTGPLDSLIAAVNKNVLNGTARAATLHTFRVQANELSRGEDARALVVGLALGSPEFERH